MKKLTINEANYEAFALDYLEGDLNTNERLAFESFLIDHPHIDEELKAMNLVYLKPEDEIVFADKHLLTRNVYRLHWKRYMSIAATILLLIVAGALIFNSVENKDTINVATNEFEGDNVNSNNPSEAQSQHSQVSSDPTQKFEEAIAAEAKRKAHVASEDYENTTIAQSNDRTVVSNNIDDIAPNTIEAQPNENHDIAVGTNELTKTEDVVGDLNTAGSVASETIGIKHDEKEELIEKETDPIVIAEVEQLNHSIGDLRVEGDVTTLNTESIDPINTKTKINLKGLVPTAFEKQEIAVNTKRPKLFKALIPETLSR